jgi:uncharacterized protein
LTDISEGIELFNKADFFSAHDFFEKCWIESDRKEKMFFQGMVQVSVGCYHIINGNFKSSLSQLKKGTKKLNSFRPSHRNIDLENLVNIIESIIQELNDFIFEQDPQMFWNKIPKIRLND